MMPNPNLAETKQALAWWDSNKLGRLTQAELRRLEDALAAARAYVDLMEGAEEVWWCDVHRLPQDPVTVTRCAVVYMPLHDPDEDRCGFIRVRLVPVSEEEK